MVLPNSSNYVSSALINKLLPQVSNTYVPEDGEYVCERLLPLLSVRQDSGLIGNYGDDHLIIENDVAGGESPYPRVTANSRDGIAYQLAKFGLSQVIPEEDFANVDGEGGPFAVLADATRFLTSRLWLAKEQRLASIVTDPAIITQNVTLGAADQYDNYTSASSTPIADAIVARETTRAATGVPADTAVMDWQVFEYLRRHPQIRENAVYVQDFNVGASEAQVANALGVQRLLIPRVSFNSAAQGQTSSLMPLWNKDIFYCVAPTAPSRYQTTVGYRLQRGASRRITVEALRDPVGADKVLIDDMYQFLVTNAAAGYLIQDAIS